MFVRHHASICESDGRTQQLRIKTLMYNTQHGRLAGLRTRWDVQSRCRVKCAHGRSNSSNASSVRTAVAALHAHELTCEAHSSSVQDLLLVEVATSSRKAGKQRHQSHPHDQTAGQQAKQRRAQHHFDVWEEQLHAQSGFEDHSSAHLLQQHCILQQQQQRQCQVTDQFAQQQELHAWQQQMHQWQRHVTTEQQQQDQQRAGATELVPLYTQAEYVEQQLQQHDNQQLSDAAIPLAGHQAIAAVWQQPKAGAVDSSQLQRRKRLGIYNTRGWSRPEVLQGWRFSPADNIARTPLGYAMVRTSAGSQPHSLAAQLLRWLQQEQQVVLSAAGAGRTLTALQAVADLALLVEEQQLQQQLLAIPHVRSCSRPEGGKCLVYTVHCQLVAAAGDGDVQHRQQQLQRQPNPMTDVQVEQQQHVWQQQHMVQDENVLHRGQQAVVREQQQHADTQPLAVLSQRKRRRRQQGLPEQMYQPQQYSVQADNLQLQHHTSSQGPFTSASVHLLNACAADQQQQQRWQQPVNGNCSTAESQHWQQHDVGGHFQQRQQRFTSPYSRERQLQEQMHEQQWDSSTEQQLQRNSGTVAAADANIQVLEVRGSCNSLADQLDQALQQSAAVCLPVAYDKQAAKLLEAAAVLARRWRAAAQQRRGSSSRARHKDSSSRHQHSSSNFSDGESSYFGMQPVLHPREGWVQRQSGPRPGLHVYVFAVPLVQ